MTREDEAPCPLSTLEGPSHRPLMILRLVGDGADEVSRI